VPATSPAAATLAPPTTAMAHGLAHAAKGLSAFDSLSTVQKHYFVVTSDKPLIARAACALQSDKTSLDLREGKVIEVTEAATMPDGSVRVHAAVEAEAGQRRGWVTALTKDGRSNLVPADDQEIESMTKMVAKREAVAVAAEEKAAEDKVAAEKASADAQRVADEGAKEQRLADAKMAVAKAGVNSKSVRGATIPHVPALVKVLSAGAVRAAPRAEREESQHTGAAGEGEGPDVTDSVSGMGGVSLSATPIVLAAIPTALTSTPQLLSHRAVKLTMAAPAPAPAAGSPAGKPAAVAVGKPFRMGSVAVKRQHMKLATPAIMERDLSLASYRISE